jgi:PAS domain S-box-containing protein
MYRHSSPRILILAVLGILVTALAFQAWVLMEGRQRALDLIATRAANRAQATAHQVQGLLRQIDLVLLDIREDVDAAGIASRSGSTSRNADQMRGILRKRMARVPQILNIHVAGADGRYVYSSHDTLPDLSVGDRRYFHDQRDTRADLQLISEPLFGRVANRWIITSSRRLTTPDGRFAGVILAVVDAETLGSVMMAVDRQQWLLALYDRDLRLVSGPAEITGWPSQDPLLLGWAHTGQRAWRGPSLGHPEPHIWAIQELEGLPFLTVAGFSQSLALQQWRRDLRIHVWVAALLVAGCIAVLWLQHRHHRDTDRSQQALRFSEAYFRTLFDAVPDAVAIVHQGQVVDANRYYLELFQIPAGEKRPPWELVPEAQPDGGLSRDRGRRLCEAALKGELQRNTWQCQKSDGTLFEAELTLRLFHHGDRDLLVAVLRDLTDLRAMETQLHQAQKLDAVGQLAGGVAHDFNNMLAAILSSAELLTGNSTDPRQRRIGTTIVAAAERAAQLTRKLLTFARKEQLVTVPLDVHQIIREVITLLEHTIDPRITLGTHFEASRFMILGDPSQLQNALLNLGVNARDAMPDGGRLQFLTRCITLRSSDNLYRLEPGEYIQVSVSDTGCGIPEKDLPRIFDPFFTTKEPGKGTGLGLAAVYGAMRSHRGSVRVESTCGVGTSFHLALPLADIESPVPPAEPSPGMTGRGTILVIDDEEFVRLSTTMSLEALGYETLSEGDAQRGIELFRTHQARLSAVLLDMLMPGLSGPDAARLLHDMAPGVPILLMSGFSHSDHIEDLLKTCVAGFLQKPFRVKELGDALEAVVRKP